MPGKLDVGEHELELHPADGHTVDGMAVWVPWARVLVCGDYLSPVEIPMLHPDASPDAYLATLARLEPLVEEAEHVVPGHGGPIDGTRAARSCARTARTWRRCARTARRRSCRSPAGRGAQRKIHAENVRRSPA